MTRGSPWRHKAIRGAYQSWRFDWNVSPSWESPSIRSHDRSPSATFLRHRSTCPLMIFDQVIGGQLRPTTCKLARSNGFRYGGFHQWVPGQPIRSATSATICAIGITDVLVARTASGGAATSMALNSWRLRARSSGAASTTKSAPATASSSTVRALRRSRAERSSPRSCKFVWIRERTVSRTLGSGSKIRDGTMTDRTDLGDCLPHQARADHGDFAHGAHDYPAVYPPSA